MKATVGLFGLALGCTLVAALCAAALAPGAQAARSPFFGIVPQGSARKSDYARIAEVAGTVRIPAVWYELEPRQGVYDFSALDEAVGDSAAAGLRVLPFVYGTPSWLAEQPSDPPLDSPTARDAWRDFLEALVDRYGPRGSFWEASKPRMPINRWQIWNEPNFRLFWAPRPSPSEYATLLHIGAEAIRAGDSKARIMLAGVAPIAGAPRPWIYLRALLEVPGVWRDFDVVAIHPYGGTLGSMAYQIEQARLAIAATGDRAVPIQVTEFSVASSGDRKSPMVKTARGQAAFLKRAFQMFLEKRKHWRLAGADWFAWRDSAQPDPSCPFCQGAGLFTLRGEAKPAWNAFRQVSSGG